MQLVWHGAGLGGPRLVSLFLHERGVSKRIIHERAISCLCPVNFFHETGPTSLCVLPRLVIHSLRFLLSKHRNYRYVYLLVLRIKLLSFSRHVDA